CFKAFVVLAVLLFAGAALAQEPDHVSFTFEGCRNNGDILLPNGSGQFICPDKQPSQPNKDAYTGGELGKGWNELDLVPFRLTTNRHANSDTPTYQVSVAASYLNGKGVNGYDQISYPVVNAAKSDAGCSVSSTPGWFFAGDEANPFKKAADTETAIYRDLTISQAPGTTCVIDWYQRLALGSSGYNG